MTLDELSAQVAEQGEEIVALREQLAAQMQVSTQLADLIGVLREQKAPEVNVTTAAGPAPTINVAAAAAGDMEMVHHWEGNRIVRSSVKRKGA